MKVPYHGGMSVAVSGICIAVLLHGLDGGGAAGGIRFAESVYTIHYSFLWLNVHDPEPVHLLTQGGGCRVRFATLIRNLIF